MNFLKKLFKKEKEVRPVPPMPSWDEIVEIMYDEQLNFFSDEIIDVFYSTDRAMRYVILKDARGLFTYHLEVLCPFDEDEWQYACSHEDAFPAMWEGYTGNSCSLFENEEDLMNDLRAQPEYKRYFI